MLLGVYLTPQGLGLSVQHFLQTERTNTEELFNTDTEVLSLPMSLSREDLPLTLRAFL